MRKIKTVPMKLYLLLFAAVLFAFFSNDFGLVDIQKTAVVLAAGIDREEDGLLMTAQLAVPKSSDRTQGGTSSVEIEARGKTVSDCVSDLFSETGWVPKLVFCDLILLGEDLARENVFSVLDYFLRNEYVSDSCHLAVCEGKAEEVIASQSAIDDTSSLAISKLFSDASERSGSTAPTTLKDFSIGYYGASRCGYLPFLRAKAQKGVSTAAEGESEQTPQGSPEPQKIYTAEETALFSEGKMVSLLTRDETFALSLVKGKVSAGTLNAEKDGRTITLNVLKNDGSASLAMKETPEVRLKVSVTVRMCCLGAPAPIEDVAEDEVDERVLKDAEERIESAVLSLFRKAQTSGCDLFFLRRDLRRYHPAKYARWKDVLLASALPRVQTSVSTKK